MSLRKRKTKKKDEQAAQQKVISPENYKELLADSMLRYGPLGDDNGRKHVLTTDKMMEALKDLMQWMAKNQPADDFAHLIFDEVVNYHPPGEHPEVEFRTGGIDTSTGALSGLEDRGMEHVSQLPGSPTVEQLMPPGFLIKKAFPH